MDLDNTLEEGELSNDSDGYTPLERPATYSSLVLPAVPKKVESESEGGISSSSDSDSSDSDSPCFRAKKPKIKARKALPKRLGSKKRKYDVWSHRAQEDSLLALTACDVSHKDRSRAIESYDPTIMREDYIEMDEKGKLLKENDVRHRINNKRSLTDTKDASLRLVNRHRMSRDRVVKSYSRCLPDITLVDDKSDDVISVEIAQNLSEEKEELIKKIVGAVGKEKAVKLYNDVKRIEAEGGMLIMNHSRRRTCGGVYLFLLKHDDDLTKEQRGIIFEDEKNNYKEVIRQKKKKRAEEMKLKIGANKTKAKSKATNQNLPELLTRADLEKKLAEKPCSSKKRETEDVVNPPPTPETDGHVDSGDTETMEENKGDKYENDFLDLYVGNDMDMF